MGPTPGQRLHLHPTNLTTRRRWCGGGGSPSELWIFFAESAQVHSAKTDETHFGGFGTIRMACFPVFKVPLTPGAVDTVDPDNILQGLGVDGWCQVRRVRRVGWWLLQGTNNWLNSLEN